MASLSFHPSSSASCQGVSRLGSRNLIMVPATKHCQAGVGQLWDHRVCWARDDGDRREEEGDEGSGDVLLSAGTAEPELAERYLKKKNILKEITKK